MQITRLRLKNWRNFTRVDVPVAQRAFIVGPNATGKSNLLDALRFLRDLAHEEGGLQRAVRDRGGFSAIRTLFLGGGGSKVQLETECLIQGVSWSYQLTLEPDGKTDAARVVSEEVKQNNSSVLRRQAAAERDDLRRQTSLQQAAQSERFQPLVDGLRSIRYSHLVPQFLRNVRAAQPTSLEPYGSRFLERVYLTPEQDRNRRFKRINQALKGILPFFDDLHVEKDTLGDPHLELRPKHWRRRGAFQDERYLSDGTLRLLGLLWELLDGLGPLLLEEPELGLHEGAVINLPGLISGPGISRQVIVTTHAFAMFQDRGIDPAEILLVRPGGGGKAKASTVVAGGDDSRIAETIQYELGLGRYLSQATSPGNPSSLLLATDPAR